MSLAKLVTTVQVAEMLGISSASVRRLVQRRELGCVRFGRTVRFEVEAIERLLLAGSSLKSEDPAERPGLAARTAVQGRDAER